MCADRSELHQRGRTKTAKRCAMALSLPRETWGLIADSQEPADLIKLSQVRT